MHNMQVICIQKRIFYRIISMFNHKCWFFYLESSCQQGKSCLCWIGTGLFVNKTLTTYEHKVTQIINWLIVFEIHYCGSVACYIVQCPVVCSVFSAQSPVQCSVPSCLFSVQCPVACSVFSAQLPVQCSVPSCLFIVQCSVPSCLFSVQCPVACSVFSAQLLVQC